MNSEKIFFEGKHYFDSLLSDIAAAKKSIELEVYIFDLDELGKKVISVLAAAAKKGVVVKVLVDSAGTPDWDDRLIKNLENQGAETRVFHPFPWRLWQWSRSKTKVGFLLKAIYLFLKINSRNHRKVCVIDRKIVYAGSFNISETHLCKTQQGFVWRDTGVRLEDIELDSLVQAFESAWDHIPIKERVRQFFRQVRANPTIRLNNTWHRRRILHKNLLKRIKECSQRVWITNAYFVPDNILLRRLIEVAKTGVDVRILLPCNSDVSFMPWASQAFYKRLLKAGVRIFEYLPSMLHAKSLILDDWMTIGSSNLNYRSLLHDLEVDVNIRSAESKEALKQQFLLDLENAKEISLEDWERRPWYQHLVGRVLLYLKYLI